MISKKIIFIHNPKVAGTSIRRTFEAIGKRDKLKVGSTEHDDIILLPRQDNSILDHPYDVPSSKAIDSIHIEFNQSRKIRTISDYFDICNIFNVVSRINPSDTYICMFFRDVVERMISAYKHNIDRSNHVSKYYRVDSTSISVEDYISNILEYRSKHYDIMDYDCELFHNTSNCLNLRDSLSRRAEYYNYIRNEHNITAYDLHHSVPNQTSLIPGFEQKYFNVYTGLSEYDLSFKGLFKEIHAHWRELLVDVGLKHMDLKYENKSNASAIIDPKIEKDIISSFERDYTYIDEID